ncbi:uncharacterized protein LOC143446719 [Clavelina lepadiformis]|uniref:uncharacterized protein LOC143446719 n=1 Tax=Clavelina lepadiformis TaxID=159417 RepID=UPI00404190B5
MTAYYVIVFLCVFLGNFKSILGQSCSVALGSRVDCGWGGITPQQCKGLDCCWDSSKPGSPWCFKRDSTSSNVDSEGSLGASSRLDPNNPPPQAQFPYRPTNAIIQYSGSCLFHCSSVRQEERISCSNGFSDERSCLAVGCCYDRSAQDQSRQCYYPAGTSRPCPSPVCQMPSGILRRCAADNMPADMCQSLGCCSYQMTQNRVCYFQEDAPIPRNIPSPNILPPNPPFNPGNNRPLTFPPARNPPPTTTTTAPVTTTVSTTPSTTTKKMSFIDILRRHHGGSLGGNSVLDILTKTMSQLTRNRSRTDGESRDKATPRTPTTTASTTTTTTFATTTRVTTPPTTLPPPVTRRVCNWFGGCRDVVVPTEPPPTCFPTDCGNPRFYPGSTLKPPTADSPKKIVGGTRAHPFSHPWTAMILKSEGRRTFLCGAAIICQHWIVTAAHCLNRQSVPSETPDLDAGFYKIYVGRYVGWKQKYGKQVQVFDGRQDIDYMEQHHNFTPGVNRGVIGFDIALIRLRKPIQFNQYVQPACIPLESAKENELLWATGWGITKNRGDNDSRMKQIAIKVLNESICAEKVPRFAESAPEGVICAGDERYQDTCTGDSGGPVVGPKIVGRERGRNIQRWMLYGLTSLGSPSCNTLTFDQQPALYTDIYYYMPWIKARTNYCCA